ncbi:MAG: hypothetical protein C5B50_06350 [Verrucomicrobia bacterium]|nr:MAG: hypothetical protein C5B50_06350 [Verrucomicrobiota bacterium]
MSFPFNVYVAAILSAGITTAISLPFWCKWCLKAGLVDDPGHRKIHTEPTALAGGLAVMTGVVIPLICGFTVVLWLGGSVDYFGPPPPADQPLGLLPDGSHRLALRPDLLLYGLSRRGKELMGILAGAIGMIFVGVLDDKHELRPSFKFAGQLAVAAIVAASGARITLFVPSLLFSYAITILWILTLINAFNFMDNMNGLCAGLGAIGAWCFGLRAGGDGQYLVASIALLTFGALLGFLPYNFPNARVFLGDAGSHLVGYLLAVLAILPHFYSARNPHKWAVLIPLLVLAVPLGDLAWVVLLRWHKGQPFYQGDTNHLSHRLERLGLSRSFTVILIWLLAAAVGSVAVLL